MMSRAHDEAQVVGVEHSQGFIQRGHLGLRDEGVDEAFGFGDVRSCRAR